MRIARLQNRSGEIDEIQCYTVREFNFGSLSRLAMNRKKSGAYLTNICTFDIETTTDTVNKTAWMYHWQVCIDGHVIYGRTWEEFMEFLERLEQHLSLNESRTLVIYVHNLGFEFQFVKDFLKRRYGGYEIFAAQKRKPMKVSCAGFEFRCSYKLSNMSLEMFLHNEKHVKYDKLSGDLDYSVRRAPNTPLTDLEFSYCIVDVLGLYQAILCRLASEHDNIETIPLTSTGYVRRDCRNAARKQKGYRKIFLANHMDLTVYTLLKEAARGGNTHASRYKAGRILHDVDSYDGQSQYPAMMLLKRFPMTKFVPYGDVETRKELEGLLESYACLFRVTLIGVEIKPEYAFPYIPESKCRKLLNPLMDNGRVLRCDGLTMTLTDIDYKIIKKQYDIKEEYISDIHIAEYGYLPDAITGTVMEYYKRKTELKYKISQARKNGDKELESDLLYLYAKSKNRLNGIFGMCYTDPVRDEIILEEDGTWKSKRPDDIQAALDKYNTSGNSFLVYAWGVWVTAHARQHLDRACDAAGQDALAYCDTDSCKGSGMDIKAIEELNQEIVKEATIRGAYADDESGERYYLGTYENDGHYEEFKTLGAKKYCYVQNGRLHVTVSGVSKKTSSKELKSIDRFRLGFIFRESGGKELIYNESSIKEITVDGCTFETASNIAMLDSTYTIGITRGYDEIISLPLDEI